MQKILGNHRQREKILHDAETKNLTHALLISGPSGIGKFLFLQQLAEKTLGKKKSLPPTLVTVDRLFIDGVDSDMAELAKVSPFDQSHRKRLRKKTDTIGVDDLEAFTHHLHATIDGEYKILLIRDLERMTREAANKFLKILEEPPAKTLFLMTTSSEKKLLPTTLSRVRRENFSLTSAEFLKNFLEAENETLEQKISANDQKKMIQIANGRGQILQKMIADEEFFAAEQEKQAEAISVFSLSDLGKINTAELWAKKTLPEIIELLGSMERDLRAQLRKKISSSSVPLDTSQNTILKKNSAALQAIQAGKVGLQKNGNKRMVLEEVFLSL